MSFLLNLDPCEAFLRRVQRVCSRMAQNAGKLQISAATVMNLEMWLVRPSTPSRHAQSYMALRQMVKIIDVNDGIAHRAAALANPQVLPRRRLNTFDLLVAATAVEQGLTLVTHRTQRFANIPGLVIVDWAIP